MITPFQGKNLPEITDCFLLLMEEWFFISGRIMFRSGFLLFHQQRRVVFFKGSLKSLIYIRLLSFLSSNDLKLVLPSFIQKIHNK